MLKEALESLRKLIRTYVVTDNDGVDGWSGETWFLRLGKVYNLFNWKSE